MKQFRLKSLLLSMQDGSSAFAYDRSTGGQTLEFEINGDELTDTATRSQWGIFGRCVAGPQEGAQIRQGPDVVLSQHNLLQI